MISSPPSCAEGKFTTKDLANNNLPISWAFGHGAVVPLGQVLVKDDFHVVFEIGGVFAPSLVHRVQEPYRHPQTSRGVRPFDELPRNVDRMEDHSLAGAGEVREHQVFDGVLVGAVRCIIGHTY